MSKFAENLTVVIGNTPLVKLNQFAKSEGAKQTSLQIYATIHLAA